MIDETPRPPVLLTPEHRAILEQMSVDVADREEGFKYAVAIDAALAEIARLTAELEKLKDQLWTWGR